jgi:hypothetical protein
MRYARSVLLLCGLAVLMWPAAADAQFAKQKKKSKDYYVVHKAGSDECSIDAGRWGEVPVGAIGNAPYASQDYAKAAIKNLPECKGTKLEKNGKHKSEKEGKRKKDKASD